MVRVQMDSFYRIVIRSRSAADLAESDGEALYSISLGG